jgi:hypothetical protein
LYTLVSETSDHGFPILNHLTRLVDGEIIWAPAIQGAVVLTTRGGDFDLHLGQDLSIGYLSHDAESASSSTSRSPSRSATTPTRRPWRCCPDVFLWQRRVPGRSRDPLFRVARKHCCGSGRLPPRRV